MSGPIRAIAVYENGVLRLSAPVRGLTEGARVVVSLVPLAQPEPIAEPDDDYDVLRAMNEARAAGGERPLLPPTGTG